MRGCDTVRTASPTVKIEANYAPCYVCGFGKCCTMAVVIDLGAIKKQRIRNNKAFMNIVFGFCTDTSKSMRNDLAVKELIESIIVRMLILTKF